MTSLQEIEKQLNSHLNCECLAAAEACKNIRVPKQKIHTWIKAKKWPWRLAAVYACFNTGEVDFEIIERGAEDRDYEVQDAVAELCRNVSLCIPVEKIATWMKSENENLRRAAMYACDWQKYSVTCEVLKLGLNDRNGEVAIAAAKACQGADVPFEQILSWAESPSWAERLASIYACMGRKDFYPLDILEKKITDSDNLVHCTAIEAYTRAPISAHKISSWAKSEIWQKRAAAMMASIGRVDVPEEIITKGLKDREHKVRKYAGKAADQTTE